jgi:hypothetical protein
MAAATHRQVYISAAATLNATGHEVQNLFDAGATPQPLPFDSSRSGFFVAAPDLPPNIYDRKLSRSTEAQGLRLLYCAARLAPALQALGVPSHRIAVVAATPEVDAPSPCWSATEAIRREPSRLLANLIANTPPLQALALLNSTAIAHVAEGLRCQGPMAGYSSQENAGVDALIEAYGSIAEDRADAALVVSSSPNITPALYLRDERSECAESRIRGEGAAALLLTAKPPHESGFSIRIAGHARGYCPWGRNAAATLERVLHSAFAAEKLGIGDIGAVFGNKEDALIASAVEPIGQLRSCSAVTGFLGASALLTEIAFACLHDALPPYRLLLGRTPAGHCHALALAVQGAGL